MSVPRRAALYLRQSIDHSEGIERQRERVTALATARGWDVAGTFVDNDTSASKPRGATTGWGRMLHAIERREVDVVIAVDLDRLLRSTRDLNVLIDAGAAVVTVDGEIDLSTADGEFRATMLAGIARFETRRRHERQVRAYEAQVAKGQQVGGWRPFGYAGNGSNRQVPREASAIRAGYRDLLTGSSLAAIARSWNEVSLRTTHGGRWDHGSVRKVLTNPRNAGIVTYRGQEQPGVVAAWLPIVEESTFRAAEALLANPDRRTAIPGGRRLLSGIAVCGVCGGTVHAGGGNKPGRGTYRCKDSTGHVARIAEPVDEFVERVMVARLARPDARDLLVVDDRPDAAALREQATAVQVRLDDLSRLLIEGILTEAGVREQSTRLRSELGRLHAQLADAGRVDVLGPLVGAEDVQAAWDALGVERQRVVVATLCKVTVRPPGRGARVFDPASVGIEWRSGAE